MTPLNTAVLMGPKVIRGPAAVDVMLASIALECIDDRMALVDDCVVAIDQVWQEVMGSVVGPMSTVVLVLPSWWPANRASLVVGAVPKSCVDVVVLGRAEVLRTDDSSVVVEIADDFVVVHTGQAPPEAIARVHRGVCAVVADRIGESSAVVVDAPSGVVGGDLLGAEIAGSLRTRGIPVSVVGDDAVLRVVRAATAERRRVVRRPMVKPRAVAAAASMLSVAVLAGAAGVGTEAHPPHGSVWAVEGRVTLEVPEDWTVERITTGPGSARLQVVSPTDQQAAIHLTQSPVPMQQSLRAAAEVLRGALDMQPRGVFVEFKTADRRADRPVITYQEVRADHRVDWTVMLDGGVRIAIGCQRAGDSAWPQEICDTAIRSARVVP